MILARTVRLVLACLVFIGLPAIALEWESGPGFRSAALTLPGSGKSGFVRLSGVDTGITFSNQIAPARYTTNQIYLNGSGVTAGDVDGDGLCDLFFAGLGGQS